jgi:protease IV
MKDFVKMTLAVICGLFIMGIIGFMLFFGAIGSLAALGSSTPVLPRSCVLTMDFSRIAFAEQSQDVNPIAAIQGNDAKTIGLWDAVTALRAAAADPAVEYLYIKSDGLSAGLSQAEELRQAISEFRKSGKAAVAYIENPTVSSYYIASAADKIYMGNYQGGTILMTGIGSQLVFLKDILDKFGVNVQLIRHGKYKSAGEMYIRNSPSPENLEQNQEMINSLWDNYSSLISESRGITREQLSALIDDLSLNTPEDFLNNHLADELLTKEELKTKLADLAIEESYKDVKFIPFEDYVAVRAANVSTAKRKIAIIFAEGEILDGDGKQQVAGDRFADIIAGVRADSTVKAVVLRVASPGGSVLASEKIRTEIDLLRKVKPVIASYGDYAASGGYWISNSCDKIFSSPSTLTGSIGVFSMIPDLSKTAKDVLHVGITTVGSSKHTDMYSMMRPLDSQEYEFMQKSVDNIYEAFLSNVSEGRGMSTEDIDEIAQGRVWTGSDALKIGLVDELGTFYDAVKYAAITGGNSEADLDTWQIVSYPKPQTTMEMIMETLTGSSAVLAGTPFESVEKAYRNWDSASSEHFFARMPFVYVIK